MIKIKELNFLVNLKILHSNKNKITQIEELNSLVNLQELDLCDNKITEINDSLKIISCICLKIFYYDDNVNINRNKLNSNDFHIYNDF